MNSIFDIKILLAFYLVQLTSLTNNTLGKQLKEYVYENRILQHIINLIFIFVIISIIDANKSINSVIIDGLMIYILYILSTKLDLQFNLLILGAFVLYYFYKREIDISNMRIISDSDIDNEIKNNIVSNNNFKYNIFGGGIIAAIIYCMYIYMNRKVAQYGGGFKYDKFLLF